MYDMNDILARLQKGESLEAIGNEFAQAMNEAQTAYVKAQKEAEEKAKAAKMADCRKRAVNDILDAIGNYASFTEYGTVVNEWLSEATDKDIEDLDAQLMDMLKMIEALKNLTFTVQKAPKIQKSKEVSADEALNEFLKVMGLR